MKLRSDNLRPLTPYEAEQFREMALNHCAAWANLDSPEARLGACAPPEKRYLDVLPLVSRLP